MSLTIFWSAIFNHACNMSIAINARTHDCGFCISANFVKRGSSLKCEIGEGRVEHQDLLNVLSQI